MDIEALSKRYEIKRLEDSDSEDVLNLYNSNLDYFRLCPPLPTIESVKQDLRALPANVDSSNKYYLGFYERKKLIGIIDLIVEYPDDNTCFIGLFMIRKEFQNNGIGSSLIEGVCSCLSEHGYHRIQLAYIIDNITAKNFWLKNKFMPIKQTKSSDDKFEVILSERYL